MIKIVANKSINSKKLILECGGKVSVGKIYSSIIILIVHTNDISIEERNLTLK